MVFKQVPYRLGSGKNMHGICDGSAVKIFYRATENNSRVVRSKILVRRAGFFEVTKGDEEFEAVEVVPLENRYFVSGGDKKIKLVDYV